MNYTIIGADGSYTEGSTPTIDLPAGTYTVIFSDQGVSSLESDPLVLLWPATVNVSLPEMLYVRKPVMGV